MHITFGKIVLLIFVVLGILAVAHVLSSPEFQHVRVARPGWF